VGETFTNLSWLLLNRGSTWAFMNSKIILAAAGKMFGSSEVSLVGFMVLALY